MNNKLIKYKQVKRLIIPFLIVFSPIFCRSQFANNVEANKEFAENQFKPVLKSVSVLLNQYDQKFVHIDVAVNDTNTYISGSVQYKLLAKSNIDTVYFEFAPGFIIDSTQINSQNTTYYYSNDTIFVFAQSSISTGTQFWIQVWYHGISATSGAYRGIINTYDSNYQKYITWTLSESFHLKNWLPCKQDLTDRLDSAWIFITVDSSLKAGSNGKLSQITQMGNGKVRYEWKEHHPIVYYLLSLAVGDYIEHNVYAHPAGYSDSIIIQNYFYNNPQFITDNALKIAQMAPLVELYSEKFGLYPWADEKFGHVMCPVGGGMEHQTMTSLGYLDTWLVAHELTHQWFGDHITCANWQDIWINEGFASYGEYIYAQDMVSQVNADENMAYCHKRARSEPNGSVYVPFADVWNEGRIFNGNLSYKKGSAIIHMLRYLSNNDSLFFVALKQMQTQFADSVITGEDVKNIFENINGKSFDEFFDQYYYGEGFPFYILIWQQDSTITGFDNLKIQLVQWGSSANNQLFTTPLQIKISFAENPDSVIVIQPSQNVQIFNVDVNNNKVSGLTFDPQNWILDSLLYIFHISQEVAQIKPDDFFISLNPNPATENLYFRYSGPDDFNGSIKFLDLSGREILLYPLDSKEKIIPLNGIKPGMYLAEIRGNHINLVRKMVMVK
ncbi:MAG: hypothetical protein COX07_07670 [Bacteroidetes bacterium CG23_combo_of_CG06-09_8_20_14_all_32_9]|nr:MAG: hypothetical protein COX07_07670 [Bacteroidetes bacterium CG23_combo_of_CG06-09_8_20_14_all_32_9]